MAQFFADEFAGLQMTLVINVIRPGVGIWQSADNELRRDGLSHDHDACKQLVLRTSDGAALLGYSGLAETPAGTPMIEWLASLLAPMGRLRVEDLTPPESEVEGDYNTKMWPTLATLVQGLNSHVRQWPQQYQERPLAILGGVLESGVGCHAIAIGRVDGVLPSPFAMTREDVTRSQYITVSAVGSGNSSITDAERLRIYNNFTLHADEPAYLLGSLARLNRDVAQRRSGDVSQWCQTIFMPWDLSAGGVHGKSFQDPGARTDRKIFRPPRLIALGLDMTAPLEHQHAQYAKEDRDYIADEWFWSG